MTQFDSQQPPPPNDPNQQPPTGGPGSPAAPGGFSLSPSDETWPGPISADEKTMGMLAHLLIIFTGFVGPLIIWLIKKDQSRYVEVQAKEALNFVISWAIYMFGLFILGFLLMVIYIGCLFSLLGGLVVIGYYVFAIIGTVKANQGIIYRYPANLRLIK